MHLVTPSEDYEQSYLQALTEVTTVDGETQLYSPKEGEPFEQFTARLRDWGKGLQLPEGWVASTELWLVEGETFIGRVSLRHTLTAGLLQRGGHIGYYVRPSERHRGYGKAILSLVLQEARQMGIKKVLITCDETNIASKKIIEANGGVLENVVVLRKGNPATLRYWIPLS